MIIRLTQKLADKIKVAPPVALPRDPDPLADWAANLFTVRRTQYILLTNSAILYSVIFPGRGITDAETFIDHAITTLMQQMHSEGHYDIFKEKILPLATEIAFSKTGDRSLLGSMNDHIRCAKVHLEHQESPENTAIRLNATPMGALDHRYPKERTGGKVIPFPRRPGQMG